METKQIILIDGSHLLSEMLQRILNRVDDLEVVDILRDLTLLPDVIDQKKPDWVIFSQQSERRLPEEITELFGEHPNLHVLTITMDTGDLKIDWIGHRKKKIKVTTVEGLTDTLRSMPATQYSSSSG